VSASATLVGFYEQWASRGDSLGTARSFDKLARMSDDSSPRPGDLLVIEVEEGHKIVKGAPHGGVSLAYVGVGWTEARAVAHATRIAEIDKVRVWRRDDANAYSLVADFRS
jgi:hypothetical protein